MNCKNCKHKVVRYNNKWFHVWNLNDYVVSLCRFCDVRFDPDGFVKCKCKKPEPNVALRGKSEGED